MNSTSLLPAALRRPENQVTPRLLLSRAEAAKSLGISERMLDTLTEPIGPLKPVRIGRRVLFAPAVLHRWIAAESAGLNRHEEFHSGSRNHSAVADTSTERS